MPKQSVQQEKVQEEKTDRDILFALQELALKTRVHPRLVIGPNGSGEVRDAWQDDDPIFCFLTLDEFYEKCHHEIEH